MRFTALLTMALLVAACAGAPGQPSQPAPTTATQPPQAAPAQLTAQQAAAPKLAPAKVRIRLDYTIEGSHAPFFVALDKGYYEAEGLFVEVLEGSGSGTTIALVGAGKDEFGYASATAVASAVTNDVPVQIVALLLRSSPYAIMFLKSSGIKTMKDLEGKKVGLVAGSSSERFLKTVLKKNNVDLDKVSFVAMKSTAQVAALLTKQIDTFAGFNSTYMPQLIKEKADADFISFAAAGLNTVGLGLLTSRSYAAKNPDVVQRVLRATIKGFEFARQNPEESIKIMQGRFPRTLDPDVALLQWQQVTSTIDSPRTSGKPIGLAAQEDWDETLDVMMSVGDLKSKPAPGFWTNEFLPKS